MRLFAATCSSVFLAATLASAAETSSGGAPRVEFKVKNFDVAEQQSELQKAVEGVAGVKDVLIGKDGTVMIVMVQEDKEKYLRLSHLRAAVKKIGEGTEIDEASIVIKGTIRLVTPARPWSKVEKALKDVKGIDHVKTRDDKGKNGWEFYYEIKADAKDGAPLSVIARVLKEHIDDDQKTSIEDIGWVSEAKKKSTKSG